MVSKKHFDFINDKKDADILLMGSQSVDLNDFPKCRAIFRAGIGRDNVPISEASKRKIKVRFPSKKTINHIYDETASFTCGLIFRMLYNQVGSLSKWQKNKREQLNCKSLLVIGKGNIGNRIKKLMSPFLNVLTYDIIDNDEYELENYIRTADCITLHIPLSDNNISFMNKEKLSWMKDNSILINTSRGKLVNENDLYNELSEERIYAAFDVFWNEPYHGKLFNLPPERFFMTPHVASTSNQFIYGCKDDIEKLILEL